MKILAVSYSQTGQLTHIVDCFAAELHKAEIDRICYSPEKPFPFPWTSKEFFHVMPESMLEIPVALSPVSYKYERYDLVIFAYQPWFLSPSIPSISLLESEDFKARLKGTPVITIVGSRNMWINSQKSIAERIRNAGGKLIGNIPFIDRNQNQISAVTIMHWMFSGEKTRMYGLFPLPGISGNDIASASVFGKILDESILGKSIDSVQEKFYGTGFFGLGTDILFIEQKAKRIFSIWAFLITKWGNKSPGRRAVLESLFKYYLLIALFIVAPVVYLFYRMLVVPFTSHRINEKKEYICKKMYQSD